MKQASSKTIRLYLKYQVIFIAISVFAGYQITSGLADSAQGPLSFSHQLALVLQGFLLTEILFIIFLVLAWMLQDILRESDKPKESIIDLVFETVLLRENVVKNGREYRRPKALYPVALAVYAFFLTWTALLVSPDAKPFGFGTQVESHRIKEVRTVVAPPSSEKFFVLKTEDDREFTLPVDKNNSLLAEEPCVCNVRTYKTLKPTGYVDLDSFNIQCEKQTKTLETVQCRTSVVRVEGSGQ